MPCRAEAPHLSRVHAKYRDQGFAVLAVNAYDDSKRLVRKFVRQHNLGQIMLLNGGRMAREIYRVYGYPTSLLIGRDGRVIDRWLGQVPMLESKIVQALASSR